MEGIIPADFILPIAATNEAAAATDIGCHMYRTWPNAQPTDTN